MFRKQQEAQLDAGKMEYFSPDEMERMKKVKLKVRQKFQKFFRLMSLKQSTRLFLKWKSYVQFQQNQEEEFQRARAFTQKKKNFLQKLKDEKAKQKAMVILGEFQSMNTKNIKGVEDSIDEKDMNVDIKLKPGDNLAWLTDYKPA